MAAANPTLAPLLERSALLKTSILPTVAGRAEPPRWALSQPPAYDGTGSWSASAVYVNLEAKVDPALAGMPLDQVEALVRSQHRATLAAIQAATAAIASNPGCTAAQLRSLLRCHGDVLARTAPGSASAVLVTGPWLPNLLGELGCKRGGWPSGRGSEAREFGRHCLPGHLQHLNHYTEHPDFPLQPLQTTPPVPPPPCCAPAATAPR